jgi:hypothetical protein
MLIWVAKPAHTPHIDPYHDCYGRLLLDRCNIMNSTLHRSNPVTAKTRLRRPQLAILSGDEYINSSTIAPGHLISNRHQSGTKDTGDATNLAPTAEEGEVLAFCSAGVDCTAVYK